jgi:hypothetical protein
MGNVNPRQAQMLGVVDDRVDDLHNLVDNMLHLVRLRAGEPYLNRRAWAAGELLERVRIAAERKLTAQGKQLEWKCAAELPDVFCDDDHLQRALNNLVQYAAARRDRSAPIEISVSESGDNLLICIPHGDREQLDATPTEEEFEQSVPLKVARQLIDWNYGEFDDRNRCEFVITLPTFHPERIVKRHVEWLSARHGATQAAVYRCECRAADAKTIDAVRQQVGAALRYYTERYELVVPTEDHWRVVAPVNEDGSTDWLARFAKMTAELGVLATDVELSLELIGQWELREGVECLLERACNSDFELAVSR